MPTAFEKIGMDRALQDHWVRRVIAALIDSIIISIIAFIITTIAQALIPTLSFGGVPFLTPADLVRGLIFVLYAAFLESSIGATFGKQIMNLKVTTTSGNMLSLDRAFIRDISKILPWVWLIDTLVGMATTGDPHQKISDRYAGTTVVSTIARWMIVPPSSTQPATSNPPIPP